MRVYQLEAERIVPVVLHFQNHEMVVLRLQERVVDSIWKDLSACL